VKGEKRGEKGGGRYITARYKIDNSLPSHGLYCHALAQCVYTWEGRVEGGGEVNMDMYIATYEYLSVCI